MYTRTHSTHMHTSTAARPRVRHPARHWAVTECSLSATCGKRPASLKLAAAADFLSLSSSSSSSSSFSCPQNLVSFKNGERQKGMALYYLSSWTAQKKKVECLMIIVTYIFTIHSRNNKGRGEGCQGAQDKQQQEVLVLVLSSSYSHHDGCLCVLAVPVCAYVCMA